MRNITKRVVIYLTLMMLGVLSSCSASASEVSTHLTESEAIQAEFQCEYRFNNVFYCENNQLKPYYNLNTHVNTTITGDCNDFTWSSKDVITSWYIDNIEYPKENKTVNLMQPITTVTFCAPPTYRSNLPARIPFPNTTAEPIILQDQIFMPNTEHEVPEFGDVGFTIAIFGTLLGIIALRRK